MFVNTFKKTADIPISKRSSNETYYVSPNVSMKKIT